MYHITIRNLTTSIEAFGLVESILTGHGSSSATAAIFFWTVDYANNSYTKHTTAVIQNTTTVSSHSCIPTWRDYICEDHFFYFGGYFIFPLPPSVNPGGCDFGLVQISMPLLRLVNSDYLGV